MNQFDELLKRFEALPPKQQAAAMWIFRNYDFVMKLCATEKLTPESREYFAAQARQKGDDLMLALIFFEQSIHSD